MTLTTQLSRQVDSQIQQRGRQYYLSGAVQIHEGGKDFVRAMVRGSDWYRVSLLRERKDLLVWCTCPYYQDHLDPCKHVWATLLAAESQGHLRGTGNGDRVRLLPDDGSLDWDEDDDGRPGGEEWDEEGYDDDQEEDASAWQQPPVYSFRSPPASRVPSRSKHRFGWKEVLSGINQDLQREQPPSHDAWPAGREILYLIDAAGTLTGQGLLVEVAYRERKRDGEWSKPKSQRISLNHIPRLPDADDRQVLALLVGAKEQNGYYSGYGYSSYYDSAAARYRLTEGMVQPLVASMCRTGRCFLRLSGDEPELHNLQWDDGKPWEFWLELSREEAGKRYLLTGALRRDSERVALSEPALLVRGGLVFWKDRVARLEDAGAFDWISRLRQADSVSVPLKQAEDLLKRMLQLPHLPRLDLPEELRFEEVAVSPRPRLKVKAPDRHHSWGPSRLKGELSFDYDGEIVPSGRSDRGIYQPKQRRLVLRDVLAELAAAERLRQLGFRAANSYQRSDLELAPRNLPRLVRTLLGEGWHVEAEGKVYRRPGNFRVEVNSGIDWFELHGSVEYGDTSADLPELLAALKRGDNTVRLGDGTFGLVPEEWLKKYGMLAGLGKVDGDHVRFSRTQVGLLDALLASQPESTSDALFQQARDELNQFQGIEPSDPPAGFVGELRGYQREGLGWLYFLQKFGFGGCLADDMGLGKTVQVLALLESRRELRANARPKSAERPGPSLVVVPRSLVFNWKAEAARFTPQLRVLDHTGITRTAGSEHFADYDVVLTTYGTLRRDILHLKDFEFDYCILDEAQAIKNAATESAKAARLLRGRHRLALSGTPVENHLGELWSLFEFLNPGMLGAASVLRLGTSASAPDEETRTLLARGLRPFILRRTKAQVARDLPAKLEQTIYCELGAAQRKRYDELRDHYRLALLARVERDGLNKSKMQILEALLRLRQAACHPGLIDKTKVGESSAKLDALLPQLGEVTEQGHKALVFSQFTSLLSIVRQRIDAEKIPYEYLDGRTRDRAARVERFQSDPDCKLFLISLKAGGLGLNLTAAEYVFLLDPWWNPAVEAQAIDRTHRIGQTQRVFAYRLIAKDTVEEKVLELQKTKRDLADAIINADNSLIRNLGREDLELLLS